MNTAITIFRQLFIPLCLLLIQPAWAQNAIEALGVSQQGNDIVLKLTTSQPLDAPPASFSVAKPPRRWRRHITRTTSITRRSTVACAHW